MTITPGKSGEAIRGLFLKDLGVPVGKSFGIFFAERVFDLTSVALLAAGGLWIHPKTRPILLILTGAFAALFYILHNEKWLRNIAAFLKKMFPKKLSPFFDYFLEVGLAFGSCINSSARAFLYIAMLGLLAWAAEGLALYSLLNILGHRLPLITSFFIYGFSLVIGGVTLLPGGLGGAELAMIELLQAQQISTPDAVAATLLIRLTTLWFSVFLGMLAFPKRAIFIISSKNSGERGKSRSKRSVPNEEGMALAMFDEEDRSGEAAAGRIPDEVMKVAPAWFEPKT